MKNQFPTLFSTFQSAFKPINLSSKIQAHSTKASNVNQQNSILKPVHQLSIISNDKTFMNDGESWRKEQIKRLFKLYDYYGPQWKIMSQQMPNRTANNLKNRFYTVLRNLIKSLFRRKSDTCPKLSGQIPSKDLSRLYDAKQDYTQFQSLVRNMLMELSFDLESPKISGVSEKYSDEIEKIYLTIYGDRVQEIQKQSNESFQKMNDSEKMLQVTSLPVQKISSSSQEQSDVSKNVMGKSTECMYFFFFNPADMFA